MTKTIVLVDPFYTGHHESYMRMFSVTLLSLGHRVFALYPKPEELRDCVLGKNPDWSERFHVFQLSDIEPYQSNYSFIRKVADVTRRWSTVKRIIKHAVNESSYKPDLVFFCYLDSYLYEYLPKAFIAMFPFRWSGLYFQPRHLRDVRPFHEWKRLLCKPDKFFNTKNCSGIGVLDEGIVGDISTRLPTKLVQLFPDYSEDIFPDVDNSLIKKIREKSGDRKIVLLSGSLDKRKGILTLIRISKLSYNENIFYVIAGKLSEESFSNTELEYISDFKITKPNNCYIHLNYIDTEALFNALICISDLIYAVYEEFPHSSNMLTKAAFYRKPVIVSDKYCMGERVKRYNLGSCVEASNPVACLEGITKLLSEEAKKQYGFAEYLEQHSIEKLKNSLQIIISGSD